MPTTRPSLRTHLAILAGLVGVGVAAALVVPPRGGHAGAAIGGPFTLVSQDGVPVTQQVLAGHPTLVFFGYTHCPDICPTALSAITGVLKTLGDGDGARALFITVDPARDTPVVLKDYMSSFDPRITALTGTPEAIAGAERAYRVDAKVMPDADGTTMVDHTGVTYLMDKAGRFVGPFDLDRPAGEAAAELRRYF